MSYALLVDDNEEALLYLSALLTSQSFLVETASNGEEALAFARRTPPLIVISDLLMPVLDGYTLLRHWKADGQLRNVPFIIYTATYTSNEDRQLGRTLGADAYILKATEPNEFLLQMRHVLARRVVARPLADAQPDSGGDANYKQYSAALVRTLEHRTQQLNAANKELQQRIGERDQMAARQRAILDALPALVKLIDSQGVIVEVNDSRRFATNGTTELANFRVGENYLSACDAVRGDGASDAKQAAAGIKGVLSGILPTFSMEYGRDNLETPGWFRMHATPLHTNQRAGAVIMHVDVTDRKVAELRLRESEEQYLLLLNSTAEGIYGLDLNGVCTFCNAAAARYLGYTSRNDIVGERFHARHHFNDSERTFTSIQERAFRNAFRTDKGMHVENDVLVRLDGSQFSVEYWSYPIHRAGIMVGTVVTFLDTTERRSLEAKFLQSQKMEAVGRLAGGVAHDFNNALQVLLGSAELLSERLAGDPEGQKLVMEIHSTGNRAAALTRQLLAFSRKQMRRPVVLDLNELIRGMEGMLRPMIGEDIQLLLLLDQHAQPIEADGGQIEQVLMNLAVNARDAMPNGGKLIIRTSRVQISDDAGPTQAPKRGPHVLLTITDSGFGMDDKTRARIFEPYFTTKEAEKGTGLGLSTVYGIVNQSGGSIDVESKPGEGATFHIHFPLADGPIELVPTTTPIIRKLTGSETILVVEDEDALRALLTENLRAYGYTVLEAENGKRAILLGQIADTSIDLLLTDVILPDIGGRQVADQMLDRRSAMRVIYMSGYTADFISASGVVESGTVLLEKPFALQTLLRTVRQLLDQRSVNVSQQQLAL